VSRFVREAVKLRELFDRTFDGNRINEIGEAGRSLFLDAIEAAGGAVPLERSDIARKARLIEQARHVLQRQWKCCRGLPRCVGLIVSGLVVDHEDDDTPARRTARRLSPLGGLRSVVYNSSMPAKKKSAIQELSEFVRDHMATRENIRDLKGSIIRLSEQVTSIEGELRGMKRAKLEFRVADLEEKVFGKSRA
jgi:hypothetical protein